MQTFWEGFEKEAEKKKEEKARGLKNFGRGLATASVGGLLVLPSASAYNAVRKFEPGLSRPDLDDLTKKIIHKDKLHSTHVLNDMHGAFYLPGHDTVTVPKNARASELAHELGHAKSLGRLHRSGRHGAALSRGILKSHGLRNLAPGLALMSGNEKAENAAPYMAPVLSAPLLAEEAKASYHGLRNLQKFKGTKAMLRGIPTLGTGLASYAIPIAGTSLAAHYFVKKKREAQLKKGGNQ